jgi:hypothetical protein
VRLRSSATAYFNRTQGSPTNQIKWTWSGWVKLGTLGVDRTLFGAANSGTFPYASIFITSANELYINASLNGATSDIILITTAVYRDPSAWYHIVFVYDSAQATSTNRCSLYVNGVQVTSFSSATYPGSSVTTAINTNTYAAAVGRRQNGATWYFDGYLTEINFIDGQALTPSSFGSTNAITGVWQPAKYTGTYGTNGFYLNFSDNSAVTTSSNVGIGKDFSGNGNYWTSNNILLSAGVTYDSMTDVPTLTSATAANYPTINAVNYNSTYITLSQANLRQTYAGVSAAAASQATMAIPTTGKWYWEVYINATGGGSGERIRVGICSPTDSVDGNTIDNSANHYMQMSNGQKRTGTTDSTYGASFSATQIIQVLYDATAGSIYFGQNDSFANGSGSFNQTFSTATAAFTSLSGTFIPAFVTYGGADIAVNFGQRPFSYTPPTGFVALNTYNLPASTITNGAAYMAATTWTSTGTTQTVTNGGNNTLGTTFQPDFLWIKSRNNASGNYVTDSVRGASKYLVTNSTAAEVTDAQWITSLNSDGFSIGTNNLPNTWTNVAWQWKKGASSGFDIVSQTLATTGINTITHSLNAVPTMVLAKKTSAGAEQWLVYQSSGTTQSQYLGLNNANGVATSGNLWGSSAFTSSQIYFNGTSGITYVFYIFAPVAGFSVTGSYTGNSSTDGTFVYTGFRPRFVLIKGLGSGGSGWQMNDSSRNTYNPEDAVLRADLSNAENIGGYGNVMDFLSNGFKLRTTDTNYNSSSTTYGPYIYIAFAENPFRNALAR